LLIYVAALGVARDVIVTQVILIEQEAIVDEKAIVGHQTRVE
jgi:hypothetical protein